jgi:DNA processing protein
MENIYHWLWLSKIPGIGSKKFVNIYKHFKDIEKVYQANELDFHGIPHLSKNDIRTIMNNKDLNETYEYMKYLKKQKVDLLLYKDNKYPTLLKEIYDPPAILYCKGKLEIDEVAISIVGSRKASYYGLKMAEKLAYELASLGVTIISGMAKGIDTYAHKGALQTKGKTIAVLGCGVDVIYPTENAELMKEIEKRGLIISEYPLKTFPKANNFPARNRIISGLSMGTIIIEAGEKSGSLITAEFALEQGRNVYAIPGNIDTQNSRGSNNLLKEGAKIVTKVEDILEDLVPYLKTEISSLNKKFKQDNAINYKELTSEEKNILEKIKMGYNHDNDIINACNYTASVVNSNLTMLELKGIIEKHRNQYFIK